MLTLEGKMGSLSTRSRMNTGSLRTEGVAGGSDLVSNGGFDGAAAEWTPSFGWSLLGDGVATAAGSSNVVTQNFATTNGSTYETEYTVVRSGGSVTIFVGNALGTARSTSGTFTEDIVSGGVAALNGCQGAAFTGTVDDISVNLKASLATVLT